SLFLTFYARLFDDIVAERKRMVEPRQSPWQTKMALLSKAHHQKSTPLFALLKTFSRHFVQV
ncbi:hypothetical protein FRC03_000533, partial [Tulasnella sp. 419]